MADFDPEAIEQHNATARDIENANRYVALLQGTDSKTYADIAAGCYYGTSALLHEVIELCVLLKLDRRLLFRSRQRVRRFLRDNEDAHVEALKVEYPYLQRTIVEILGEKVGIGELVRANASQEDFDRLFNWRNTTKSSPTTPTATASPRKSTPLRAILTKRSEQSYINATSSTRCANGKRQSTLF